MTSKIRAAESIVIFGHRNADGDSVGSALGLCHLVKSNFDKDAVVAYDGNMPISYDFMPGRGDFIFAEKIKDNRYDLMILVDVGAGVQLGDAGRALFSAAGTTIKIDHHKTFDVSAELEFVDDGASSAAEMIFDIACAADWKINADAATCLCAGIYADTGNFAFVSGNSRPLRAVAELVDLGADIREISEGLNIATRHDILAQANVIAAAEFFHNGRLAMAVVPNKYYKKLDSGETEMIFFLRRIKGVEFVVVLKEARADEIGVSLRSRRIPIRELAEKIGGGGHDLAAGGRLHTNLAEAKKVMVEAFKGL